MAVTWTVGSGGDKADLATAIGDLPSGAYTEDYTLKLKAEDHTMVADLGGENLAGYTLTITADTGAKHSGTSGATGSHARVVGAGTAVFCSVGNNLGGTLVIENLEWDCNLSAGNGNADDDWFYVAGVDASSIVIIRNNIIQNDGNSSDARSEFKINSANCQIQLYNNIIYGQGGPIEIDNCASGSVIYSNTIGYMGNNGIQVDGGAANLTVRNNIAFQCGGSCYSLSTSTNSNNADDDASGDITIDQTEYLTSAPDTPTYSTTDFTRKAYSGGGSDTITDAGHTLGSPYDTDYEGSTRGNTAYDLGADEYTEGGAAGSEGAFVSFAVAANGTTFTATFGQPGGSDTWDASFTRDAADDPDLSSGETVSSITSTVVNGSNQLVVTGELDGTIYSGASPTVTIGSAWYTDDDDDYTAAVAAQAITNNSTQTAPASTYHVATDGDDDTGDGSEGTPYATIQHAYDQCVAGDTVEIHAGTYDSGSASAAVTVLTADTNGTSGSRITIKASSGETVIISGNADTTRTLFSITADYNDVYGLRFTEALRTAVEVSGSNCEVEECWAYDCDGEPTWIGGAFKTVGPVQYVKFKYCMANGCSIGFEFREDPTQTAGTAKVPPVAGNTGHVVDLPQEDWDTWEGWTDYAARYCTMERCIAYDNRLRDEHSDGIYSRYAIECNFLENIAYGNTDDNFDELGSTRCVIRGNMAWDANPEDTVDGDGNGIKVGVRGGLYNEIVGNISFANERAGIDVADTELARVAHNACVNNEWIGIWFEGVRATTGGHTILNNACKNNTVADIAFNSPGSHPIAEKDYNIVADDNDHNWAVAAGANGSISTDPDWVNDTPTIDTDHSSYSTIAEKWEFLRNQVHTAFSPDTGSPMVEEGAYLTTTNGTGSSSTTVTVDDDPRNWFIVGDTIQIAGAAPTPGRAAITAMDATTITIDTALSWADAAGVTLPYDGVAQNIGPTLFLTGGESEPPEEEGTWDQSGPAQASAASVSRSTRWAHSKKRGRKAFVTADRTSPNTSTLVCTFKRSAMPVFVYNPTAVNATVTVNGEHLMNVGDGMRAEVSGGGLVHSVQVVTAGVAVSSVEVIGAV